MKYEDLPQTITIGTVVLTRVAEEPESVDRAGRRLVYYDVVGDDRLADGVGLHVCYSSETGDFCGLISLDGLPLFTSLGGHKGRYKTKRDKHCYEELALLVAEMEARLKRWAEQLAAAVGPA